MYIILKNFLKISLINFLMVKFTINTIITRLYKNVEWTYNYDIQSPFRSKSEQCPDLNSKLSFDFSFVMMTLCLLFSPLHLHRSYFPGRRKFCIFFWYVRCVWEKEARVTEIDTAKVCDYFMRLIRRKDKIQSLLYITSLVSFPRNQKRCNDIRINFSSVK